MTTCHPREITPLLREALGTLPVVVVTGLRQAGKTTLLATDPAFAGRRYLTLDDLAPREAAARGLLAETGGRLVPTLEGLAVADALARVFDLGDLDERG